MGQQSKDSGHTQASNHQQQTGFHPAHTTPKNKSLRGDGSGLPRTLAEPGVTGQAHGPGSLTHLREEGRGCKEAMCTLQTQG